jgi:alpha-glucoside transport system substrate-binding protein
MRSKHRVACAALVAAGVLITACGSDKKTASTTAATTATTVAAATTTAGGATTTAGGVTTTAGGVTTTARSATTTVAGGTTATSTGSTGAKPGDGAPGSTLADGKIPCNDQYKGKKVTLFSSIRDTEADQLVQAYAAFEKCTGVDVQHEGSGEFEAQLKVRIDGGNAPDVAIIPQPGLMADLARAGSLVPEPDLGAYVTANYLTGYDKIGSVDGQFYGTPLSANVKSLVWYSPSKFKAKGYAIPTTLDEMKTLSDKIVTDGGTPWCAGIESGTATGWPVTDWIEDMMLRLEGPDVYDQWTQHKIPFNDPKVKEVVDAVGGYLKNDKYMQGGVKSIAVTSFQNGGVGVADGSCYLHHQGSFYSVFFPKGTTVGPDGDVNWFYLPTKSASDPKVLLTGGEFMAITKGNDRPEVKDTVLFMASADYVNTEIQISSRISANKHMDISLIKSPQDREVAKLLQSADVARFDGSDSMPGAVGSGTFWKQATAWIVGESTDDFLNNVEKSWPKS